MLTEQSIEFELRGPGPPSQTYTFKRACFYNKTKISKATRVMIYR